MKVANPSFSQKCVHSRLVTRLPHHWCASSWPTSEVAVASVEHRSSVGLGHVRQARQLLSAARRDQRLSVTVARIRRPRPALRRSRPSRACRGTPSGARLRRIRARDTAATGRPRVSFASVKSPATNPNMKLGISRSCRQVITVRPFERARAGFAPAPGGAPARRHGHFEIERRAVGRPVHRHHPLAGREGGVQPARSPRAASGRASAHRDTRSSDRRCRRRARVAAG